ncbi:type II toxin-antitoxin system RelE/ParE family toxin [Desulfovibrio sp.]|uniref:type II toxin-antitoxin system RelE/ParE family toxin n=1 Tax=Desulfovibrio sp. TaxID=885 RepID=UPI0039E46803
MSKNNGKERRNHFLSLPINIDNEQNQSHLCVANMQNVFAQRILLKVFSLLAGGIHEDTLQMIMSFKNEETEELFTSGNFPPLNTAQRKGLRMLRILHATGQLNSLRIPSGNRLEKLKGDREGQFSIAINMQWRICFRWEDGNAYDVEVVDYH